MEAHEKIRFLRESKDWSQEDMAKKLSMSVSGYSKIERGETKIAVTKLKKIAEILGIDIMELMSVGEKNVYFVNIGDSNGGGNIIGSPAELAFEVQKLQLINQHQHEIIAQKDKDIARLETIVELMKNQPAQT